MVIINTYFFYTHTLKKQTLAEQKITILVALLKGAQSRYFELFWPWTKLLLNWRKPENTTPQRQINSKEIITKHKRTRMVEEREDWHGLKNNEIKKFN